MELLAHAAILRDIRNYGVHPHEVRDDLERYFAGEACGLLILHTHHYLTRLAGAVDDVIEQGSRDEMGQDRTRMSGVRDALLSASDQVQGTSGSVRLDGRIDF